MIKNKESRRDYYIEKGKKLLQVWIDEQVYVDLKSNAQENGRSIMSIVEQMIKNYNNMIDLRKKRKPKSYGEFTGLRKED